MFLHLRFLGECWTYQRGMRWGWWGWYLQPSWLTQVNHQIQSSGKKKDSQWFKTGALTLYHIYNWSSMYWFKENLLLNLWLFTINSWNVVCPVTFRFNNRYRDQWQVTGFGGVACLLNYLSWTPWPLAHRRRSKFSSIPLLLNSGNDLLRKDMF